MADVISVFKYNDYREFLLATLGDKSQRKGLKSKAALAIGCHTTLISQILSGKIHLNLEQADKLNRFFDHSDDESHYFLLLVQKDRAGTRSLQNYFKNQIEQILQSRLEIKKRMGTTDAVSKDDEQKYYSSWLYAALHVALSVPTMKVANELARRFQLSENQVSEALIFLSNAGLAVKKVNEFEIGPKHIHLGASSPHIASHHRNWRLKAIQSLDGVRDNDLHYSSAISLSHEDVIVIKDKLIEQLKGLNKTIRDSKEEDIYALNFDFFRL